MDIEYNENLQQEVNKPRSFIEIELYQETAYLIGQ